MSSYEENKAEGQRPKRCSITGNLCLTDTWNLDNPPDCHCGNLTRQTQDPLYAEIDALRNEIFDLEADLEEYREYEEECNSYAIEVLREVEREVWLLKVGNSNTSYEELQNFILDQIRKLL